MPRPIGAWTTVPGPGGSAYSAPGLQGHGERDQWTTEDLQIEGATEGGVAIGRARQDRSGDERRESDGAEPERGACSVGGSVAVVGVGEADFGADAETAGNAGIASG